MAEHNENPYESPRSKPPVRQVGLLWQFLTFLLVAGAVGVSFVICCVSVCLGGVAAALNGPEWLRPLFGEGGWVIYPLAALCGLAAAGIVAWRLGRRLLWRKDMK
ncbi:hypothetical protein [Posidoniimonas corsicana]|uniref:hypothetical protein n=1 Tax=Posidoniimonas corsicana TaxID=1938618 RepID=UPI0011B71ECD|nr:hypothetical protein [Posidoniimonas corsicana]